MAGQPKTRAKRVQASQGGAADTLDVRELAQKLTPQDLERLATMWLVGKGIDPRSLTGSRVSAGTMPQFERLWMSIFLTTIQETGNVRSACRAAGISRQTAYDARETDDLFAQWWADCLADAVDLLEMSAWSMASKQDGSMVRFLLMAHRPEMYAPAPRVTLKGSKEEPLEHNVVHSVAVYLPDNGRGDQVVRGEHPGLTDDASVIDMALQGADVAGLGDPGSVPFDNWEADLADDQEGGADV